MIPPRERTTQSVISDHENERHYPRYSLRLARYRGVAEAIEAFTHESADAGKRFDLLDVGVGRGRVLRHLQGFDCFPRVRFHGIDKSARRLGIVYTPARWRLHQADAEAGLPFADQSFDIVVCEQVLEHLSRPDLAISEIVRVARPNALVILGVPIFPPGLAEVRRTLVPAFDNIRGHSRSHLQAYSLRSFVKFMEAQGGLEVDTVRGFRFVSGGPLRPLESNRYWYVFNRWLGRHIPSFATEIQVVARRRLTERRLVQTRSADLTEA